MSEKRNAIYIAGGGGTTVMSASAFGLIARTFRDYGHKVGTFYAAVGGMEGALNEDLTDVFAWATQKGEHNALARLNTLKFPASPVFRTSRHKPGEEDCHRLMDVFKAHDIHYVFLNGGNDTMEKAIILKQFAREQGYELQVIGIPKTIDNDLLATHRCPGYASFAKQVARNVNSLQWDLDSFTSLREAAKGKIKKCAAAQVLVVMGRDEGWGAAASVLAKRDDSYGPHAILTKEGGFDRGRFLDRCQNAFDSYGNLFVVASEGAHTGEDYLANELVVEYGEGNGLIGHKDPHGNTNTTDGRLGLFLKMLLEREIKVDAQVYKQLKCREEGPDYRNRDDISTLSAVDFHDAVNVGQRAADLAFDSGIDGVMVTLTPRRGETHYTEFENVANPKKGSRGMTRSLRTLDAPYRRILGPDGMMIDRELFESYIREFVDLNGPDRSEILRAEGFLLPLERMNWPLERRVLQHYN